MLAMDCQDMKEHSLPCDSETSVDYYVTTVNNCSSQNDGKYMLYIFVIY